MKRLGFSHHPGELPFKTIRTAKTVNRTWPGEIIEIHGEHGCTLPATPAVVISMNPFPGPCPPHLAGTYGSQALFEVELGPVNLQGSEPQGTVPIAG